MMISDFLEKPQTGKLPVIMQSESAGCGLACLAMVANYYNYKTSLRKIIDQYPTSADGTTLRMLIGIASSMKFSSRPLKLEIDALSQVRLPCILHWGMNHFVVLKKISGRKFVIHDPALGVIKVGLDEVDSNFTGIALELVPSVEFEPLGNTEKFKMSEFWSGMGGLKRTLFQVLTLSLILQFFYLTSPIFMQIVVDDILENYDKNFLLILASGFAVMKLVEIVVNVVREQVIMRLSVNMQTQMSSNVFRHLIRLPADYFLKRHIGDIVSRFGSLGAIRGLVTTGVVTAVIDGFMTAITLIAMFFYDFNLTLIVLVMVALYGLLRWVYYEPFKRLNREVLERDAKVNTHFMESLRAIQTIKIFQKEGERQFQWQSRLTDTINTEIKRNQYGIGFESLNRIIFGIENISVTYFGAIAVMDGGLSLGMFFAFLTYKGVFIGSVSGLISKYVELKMAGLHVERLVEITAHEIEDIDSHTKTLDGSTIIPLNGKIVVEGLSFKHGENEPFVFENISFTIEPGEFAILVGPSGCGKTTLLKCLMGLLKPTSGKIYIDGEDMHKFAHYRCQISGVLQDDRLMSGDIYENISCFDSKIDHDFVEECAKKSCIYDDIMSKSMKFKTMVGDMGSTLSGGQMQRIFIARALYRRPRILFLDEATSHLDIVSEKHVNDELGKMNVTRVSVAHRPETIRYASKIIDMTKTHSLVK